MKVVQLLQFSDQAELIAATSEAVDIRQPIEGRGHPNSNFGVIPIHIYSVTTPVGFIEGVIAEDATLAADIHDSTGLWVPIDGGDLSAWPSGRCVAMFAPFTHIRVNMSSGSVKMRVWK